MNAVFWGELIASGLIVGGVYALVAIGLNLQYGLMRILNVAHGEFLMLGAYLTFWAHLLSGINPFVFIPAVFLALLMLGVVVHRLCFKPLALASGPVEAFEARSLLISFGLMFILQNFALLLWGADLRGYNYLDQAIEIGGARLVANKLVVLAAAVLASLALVAALRGTMLGKAVRAMMQAPVGAALVGIEVERLHPLVFGIGVALAGVAGALLSMIYQISPSMGEPYTVTALIVITLGGLGSITGSLAGGLMLGVIEAIGTHLTNPSLKMLLSYGVFIGVLIARPNGLFTRQG